MQLLNGHRKRYLVCFLAVAVGSYATACGNADTENTGPSTAPNSNTGPESAATTHEQANQPPEARFEINDDLPEQGDIINFDASESTDPDGDELTYSWRFGDDLPGGGQSISHIYSDGGDYEVTLTVADSNGATATHTETVSIKDRPTPSGDAEVLVQVEDFDDQEIKGVTVSPVGFDREAVTDSNGVVTLEDMPAGEPFVLRLEKEGYAAQIKRIELPESAKEVPIAVEMQTIDATVTIEDIEDGGEAVAVDGARVEFPPESVVDSNGDVVTGDIQVQFTTFDVGSDKTIGGFPGSFQGLRQDGSETPIRSFGAMDVELFQGDEHLQVRPGKQAEIDIPAYQPGMPLGGDMPMWSLDESTGLWVEEGKVTAVPNDASPTDRVMRSKVTHFTTWNGDTPESSPCSMAPKCMVVDQDTGKPTISLRQGESCHLTVSTDPVDGLGNSCSSEAPAVAGETCDQDTDCATCQAGASKGQACSSDSDCGTCRAPGQSVDGDACTSRSDCSYTVDLPDECSGDPSINGDSCNSDSDCTYTDSNGNQQEGNCDDLEKTEYGTCEEKSCAPGGMTCSGGTLPGGQGPYKYCKTANQCTQGDLSDWMHCSGGSCSMASNSQNLFQNSGGFNESFTVPRKGGEEITVPNVDVKVEGKARISQNNDEYILQGVTNAPGEGQAYKGFMPPKKCQTYEPVVPLQHTCADGVEGLNSRCMKEIPQLFCEKVFQCGETDYAQTFTQSKGVTSIPDCVEMVKNELDKNRIANSIRAGRADYDGSKAAECLDDIINEGRTNPNSQQTDCRDFAQKAWKVSTCTGVVGQVQDGGACTHDLECSNPDSVCSNNNSNTCGGVCKPDVADSRECGNSNKTCEFSEFCNSNGKCEQLRSKGQKCGTDSQCDLGLYCDSGSGTCKTKSYNRDEGDNCNRANVCRAGLNCSPGQATDLKPNLFLVLDKSGSMSRSGKMEAAKDALDEVAEELADEANFGLLAFDSHSCPANATVQLSMDDHDTDTIQNSYTSVSPGGGTNLGHAIKQVQNDALYELPNDQHSSQRPKAVVAISDGKTRDSNGCGSKNVAEELLDNEQVYTYTIGYTSSADTSQLDDIAEAGGSDSSYTADNEDELVSVLGNISDDIITYDYSADADKMTCTRFGDAGNSCLFAGDELSGGGSGCKWNYHCVQRNGTQGVCKEDKTAGEDCDSGVECLSGECGPQGCIGPGNPDDDSDDYYCSP